MLRIPLRDPSLAMQIFRAFAAHRDTLAPLVSHCPAGLFDQPVSAAASRLLERVVAVNDAPRMPEPQRQYLIATVASVVHGVLAVWTRRGYTDPPEQVAAFLDTLLAGGLQKVVMAGTLRPLDTPGPLD